MRVALLAAATVALAATGGACGSRHGGAAAPLLAFAISDGTLPFGGCATINQPDLIQPVGAASRGHCLFFDARGTLDHAGNAAVFDYTFSWVTTGGDIVLAHTTAELVSFSTEAEHILPIGQPSTFRVKAKKIGSGESGTREVLFTALNLAPIADPGEARVLPVHGYPWTNFPQVALRWDASKSHDPDGDPLVYCWLFSQAGLPVCGTDPHDPEFIALVNVTDEGRYFASATVTDGIDTSLPVRAEVDVRTAGSWAIGAGTFAQVDPARRTVAVAGTAVALAVVPGAPEALVVASAAGGPATLSIAPVPASSPFSSGVTSALMAPALFADPANARVWALGAESQVLAEAFPVTISST
ncbi:MAG TPA: hypothetical protein VMV18_09690, partial [bacterium]|nr:hypothetical protein [bacterium]